MYLLSCVIYLLASYFICIFVESCTCIAYYIARFMPTWLVVIIGKKYAVELYKGLRALSDTKCVINREILKCITCVLFKLFVYVLITVF